MNKIWHHGFFPDLITFGNMFTRSSVPSQPHV